MTTDDAIQIVESVHPEKAILTHLGMRMIFRGPSKEAKLIEQKTGVSTVAASDGMRVSFAETIDVQTKSAKTREDLNAFF
jgi:phosphoribosyl 1,2-cyclic phosphodiesterase